MLTDDLSPFGGVVAGCGLVLAAALGAGRLARWLRVPAPALLLLAAAVASAVAPVLGSLGAHAVARVVTLALVVVLLDGGAGIGWRRLRGVLGPVLWLGVLGTLLTAAALAVLAHEVAGLDWRPALLIATALAPTDPAVVFSVLGDREVSGRAGTLLEGESGANDPVGIALLLAVLAATGGPGAGSRSTLGALAAGAGDFALQMVVGLAVGVAGGLVLRALARRARALAPAGSVVAVLAGAGVVYGVAALAHGSGFLAVFVAGVLLGDVEVPALAPARASTAALAGLAEVVAFVVLGLGAPLGGVVRAGDVGRGLLLVALLALVARPLGVGVLLLGVRMRWAERVFVAWAGLKGAVPLLLGLFAASSGVAGAGRLDGPVVVAVVVSVAVQGGSVPWVARRLGLELRERSPSP